MMRLNNSLKIKLIIIVAIFIGLQPNIKNFVKEFKKYNEQEADIITQFEKRFERVKKILPKHGVVGYFTDKKFDAAVDTKYFYLTQYALSPVIVLRNTKQQLIVANVSESFNSFEFCKNNNFHLLSNFGNGIMLFSKKAK